MAVPVRIGVASPTTVHNPQKLFHARRVQEGRPLRQQVVVGVAGLPAVLHHWQDAGGAMAVLPMHTLAHRIVGVRRKALRWGHHSVDVRRKALRAGGARLPTP